MQRRRWVLGDADKGAPDPGEVGNISWSYEVTNEEPVRAIFCSLFLTFTRPSHTRLTRSSTRVLEEATGQ